MSRLWKKWYSVLEVAEMLGYSEGKVRMAITRGDLRSVKDGKSRRAALNQLGSQFGDEL